MVGNTECGSPPLKGGLGASFLRGGKSHSTNSCVIWEGVTLIQSEASSLLVIAETAPHSVAAAIGERFEPRG